MIDPFVLLSVDKTATKREILASVTVVLRECHHDARLIAQAQKELFNPVSRAAAEFTHVIDTSQFRGAFDPQVALPDVVPGLEILDDADEKGKA